MKTWYMKIIIKIVIIYICWISIIYYFAIKKDYSDKEEYIYIYNKKIYLYYDF